MGADLSVVIVNYNTGALLEGAVTSVLAEPFSVAGRPGRAEVIVVDNASGPGDRAFLATLPPAIRLIENDENLGFAAACNQGAAAASGEYLGFLNPDARLLPRAVERLLEPLASRPAIGAAGPAFWADDDRVIRLPPSDPPTLASLLVRRLALIFPRLARAVAARWNRRALAFWRATAPLEVRMLSGACLVTRRSTMETVGPFDPGFFLYFEDADWCHRARAREFRLLYVPDAEVVHYYNQSAKTVAADAFRAAQASEVRYVAKHFGRPGQRLLALADRVTARGPATTGSVPVTDLGVLSDPPLLTVPAGGALAFQFAYDRLFVPAVAAFPEAPAFQFPPAVWSRLLPTRYFARAVRLPSGLPVQAWTWVKA